MKLSNRCRCVLCENPRKHYKKARFKRMIKRFTDRSIDFGADDGDITVISIVKAKDGEQE